MPTVGQQGLQHKDAYPDDSTIEDYCDTTTELSSNSVDGARNTVERMSEAFTDSFDSLFDKVREHHKHNGRIHSPDESNDKTIWELIKESDYTSKFAKLVDKQEPSR